MKRPDTKDQQGIVSILVTMIMMIVIALIVIGFGVVVRRNSREALDSQLGTQAYNAAESGVNMAQTVINNQLTNPGTITPVNDCKGETRLVTPIPLDGSSATNPTVGVTCLMINPGPGNLQLGDVSQTTATTLNAQSGSGANFNSLTFKWTPQPNTPGDCNGAQNALGDYPAQSGSTTTYSCRFGTLRVDILDYNSVGANFSASNLANYTDTIYMQPGISNSNPGTLTFNNTSTFVKAYQGSCIPAADSTTGALTCSVTVTLPNNSPHYYLRLSTIYQDAPSVSITGVAGGTATNFVNGQVVIDSTGRAQDQIKRIQVRVPLTPSVQSPAYALMSNGEICKDLNIGQSPLSWDAGQCATDEPNWPNP